VFPNGGAQISSRPHRPGVFYDDASGPTLERLCARLAEILGQPYTPRYLPYPVVFAAATTLQAAWSLFRLRGAPLILTNDVKAFGSRWQFSNKKLRHLGWAPRIGIDEGMEQAFAYFRDHGT
jgi:nucleoside-diphosphate-sugar epimerase